MATAFREEFKQHIFGKFAQADNMDTRLKGGTGLGLSIVKQIVLQLDGTVSFDDASDGGTIFYVELPKWEQPKNIQSMEETV
jgi:signal transduction histidine kinase